MVTAELVQAEVRELRETVDEMRKTMTATVQRTETLETQVRDDAAIIRRLEAGVSTLEGRIVALLNENEDLRSLLHDVVLWLDKALVANGSSGLSEDLRRAAATLAARIHRSEDET